MKQSTDRIVTTHAGNLIRPRALHAKRTGGDYLEALVEGAKIANDELWT